eukprot:2791577-Alexandrium_andersonii.AAC.1
MRHDQKLDEKDVNRDRPTQTEARRGRDRQRLGRDWSQHVGACNQRTSNQGSQEARKPGGKEGRHRH